jgi:Trk K+ transport system NAD-binding subunit
VQIILIERAGLDGDERYAFPTAETALELGDCIVVFGKSDDVRRLTQETE